MANPDHLSRLMEGVHAWNLWRDGRPLTEVDLRGADLEGLDLRGANLWYARLQGARVGGALLSGAVLDRSDLTLADFSAANCFAARMRGIVADRTCFSGAALVEADLTLARLLRCRLDSAIFTGATMLGANLWGSDHEAALGLDVDGGWIVEESGAVAEERHDVDRRSFHGIVEGSGANGRG